MLATLAHELPRGGDWAYEMKWDGVRALALVRDGAVRLTSRNGNDVTAGYPELAGLAQQLDTTAALLDGEIVALDEYGHASFQRLQQRMHVREKTAVERLVKQVPVAYMLFDVLWLDGNLLTPLPYSARRYGLEGLHLGGTAWQVPAVGSGDGGAALRASRDLGFEGIVAKRIDSTYQPGARSASWLKIKHHLRQELVIGGWEEGQGGRAGRIGALLVGHYADGALEYAGKVGTGFTDAELRRLADLLQPLARDDSPFVGRGVPRAARFVEPRLVAEVRFTEWTENGHVRHPAYLGLRDDKVATEVVREN